jgi:hypothetical protein
MSLDDRWYSFDYKMQIGSIATEMNRALLHLKDNKLDFYQKDVLNLIDMINKQKNISKSFHFFYLSEIIGQLLYYPNLEILELLTKEHLEAYYNEINKLTP